MPAAKKKTSRLALCSQMPRARALLAPLALLLSAALVDASPPPPLAPGAVHVNSTDALVQNVGVTCREAQWMMTSWFRPPRQHECSRRS